MNAVTCLFMYFCIALYSLLPYEEAAEVNSFRSGFSAETSQSLSFVTRLFRNLKGVVGWCNGDGENSSAGTSYLIGFNGAGGVFDIFFSRLSFLFSWETARYRLKYCLKGPLSPKHPKLRLLVCSFWSQTRHHKFPGFWWSLELHTLLF